MKNSRRQTKEQLADLLTKHSVWIHNGHGSLTNGLLGVSEVSQEKYEGAWIRAADLPPDLGLSLVFMNTCDSTDTKYVPYLSATEQYCPGWFGPYDYTDGTAVLDIGSKLNAKNYIGWDCEIKRQLSVGIPEMLMQELDSTGTRPEDRRTVGAAVEAVRERLRTETPLRRAYWWYEVRLRYIGEDTSVFDLNKKPF